jgi:D-tyrosyl-tRNA(Tyr) deacylase
LRGLIQRVKHAAVVVDGATVGAIEQGILLLLGVERGDALPEAEKLLQKVLNYRIFADAEGRMNRSLRDIGGGLLIVSQFTLVADTRKGTRPGFSGAAAPADAAALYAQFVEMAQVAHPRIATGVFGADMQITLLNDGPVTFLLEV